MTQVLSPTHKGSLGTASLNIDLQRLIQRKLYPAEGTRPKLLLHDKVIQTRNNYGINVMNGTIGFVRDIGPKGQTDG